MTNIRMQIHTARIQQALATDAGIWADTVGQKIANEAQRRCPVDEGRLRGSITHAVTAGPGRVTVVVGSPLQYAVYQHEGTGIYGPNHRPIVPVQAKALKFPSPKQMGPLRPGQRQKPKSQRGFVFAKSVKGVPPSPFLTDALDTIMVGALITDHRH